MTSRRVRWTLCSWERDNKTIKTFLWGNLMRIYQGVCKTILGCTLWNKSVRLGSRQLIQGPVYVPSASTDELSHTAMRIICRNDWRRLVLCCLAGWVRRKRLSHICKVPGWNLDRTLGVLGKVFPHSLKVTVDAVPWSKSRPVPSTSLPVHHSHHNIQCCIVRATDNIVK